MPEFKIFMEDEEIKQDAEDAVNSHTYFELEKIEEFIKSVDTTLEQ